MYVSCVDDVSYDVLTLSISIGGYLSAAISHTCTYNSGAILSGHGRNVLQVLWCEKRQMSQLVKLDNVAVVRHVLNYAVLRIDVGSTMGWGLYRDCWAGETSGYVSYFLRDDDEDVTLVGATDLAGGYDFNVVPLVLCGVKGVDEKIEKFVQFFTAVAAKYKAMYSAVYGNWLKLLESYCYFSSSLVWHNWSKWCQSNGSSKLDKDTSTYLYDKLIANYLILGESNQYSIDQFTTVLKNRMLRIYNSTRKRTFGKKKIENYNPYLNYGIWFDLSNGIVLFINCELAATIELNEMKLHSSFGACIDELPIDDLVRKLLVFCNMSLVECLMRETSGPFN